MFCRYWILLVCFPFAVSAAPVPPDDDVAKLARAYGAWTDPDKDCKYALKEGELRISLPKAWHLLWPSREGSTNNAPRVLREVEGDFTAVVRVAFPLPKQIPKDFWPYCAGGLIAWESDKAHLIVRRSGGEVNRCAEAIFSTHNTANICSMTIQSLDKQSESVYLRLKREGNQATTAWSRDGKKWKESDPVDVAWGAKMKVGVVAENCLNDPVEIVFDQYSLTQQKK